MNKNIIIVLAGGVLIAVLVAVLVQLSLSGDDEPQVAVKEEARVEILVANKDLPAGHRLVDDDLRWQKWPKSAVFSGAIVREDGQSPEDAVEGRLSRPLSVDEPLTEAVVLSADGNYLAAALDKGYRAVAIQVNAGSMAGGFIGPGDYVDVLLTYDVRFDTYGDQVAERMYGSEVDDLATETVLENIKVLAVDQRATRPEEDAKVGRTATLEVTLRQAEKLALAAEMGDLTLALRGVGDNKVIGRSWPISTDLRIVDLNKELSGMYEKMLMENAALNADSQNAVLNTSGEKGNIVRIYSGDEVQEVPSK